MKQYFAGLKQLINSAVQLIEKVAIDRLWQDDIAEFIKLFERITHWTRLPCVVGLSGLVLWRRLLGRVRRRIGCREMAAGRRGTVGCVGLNQNHSQNNR